MSMLAAVASWTRGKRYVHTPAPSRSRRTSWCSTPTGDPTCVSDGTARARAAAAHRRPGQADPAGRVAQPRTDGRLVRDGVGLEMNAYCRRAVAKGVDAGPRHRGARAPCSPSARRVPRTCCARRWPGAPTTGSISATPPSPARTPWPRRGRWRPRCAASGPVRPGAGRAATRSTARRARSDPSWPSSSASPSPAGCGAWRTRERSCAWSSSSTTASQEVEVDLPAVLSVAERLCEPCKVDARGPGRRAPRSALPRCGPRTRPGALGRSREPDRGGRRRARWSTTAPCGARRPAARCRWRRPCAPWRARGALTGLGRTRHGHRCQPVGRPNGAAAWARRWPSCSSRARPRWACELPAAAARLAARVGGTVEVLAPGAVPGRGRPRPGPTSVVHWRLRPGRGRGGGASRPTSRERAAVGRARPEHRLRPRGGGPGGRGHRLGPGRRRRGAVGRRRRRARGGQAGLRRTLVADITCRSATQMATVRPGVLPAVPAADAPRAGRRHARRPPVPALGRVRLLGERRNDDVETLARADVVIGVGDGRRPRRVRAAEPAGGRCSGPSWPPPAR